MGKLLRYVLGDPLLKHGAFKPGNTHVSITPTRAMSKSRFLNLVPKVNLHV